MRKEKIHSIPRRGRTRSDKATIRELRENDDIAQATALIARLKRLNSEFDPLLKTAEDLAAETRKTLSRSMKDKDNTIILVATSNGRLVGLAKAELRDRIFYEPRREGIIIEFYILPEFRRGQLGRRMLDEMIAKLERKGVGLIAAEFPSQNEIAKNFYTKLGFRSLISIYARSKA
jgi:ribosomal protein S18 acetylase RimI-like enzyme